MRRIEASARILMPDRKPAIGLKASLQIFSLAGAAWQSLVEGATDAEGNIKLVADLALADNLPAPNLRLLRVAGEAILSDGGPIRFDQAKGLLSVTFGEIVDLGAEVVSPVAIDRRFKNISHVIGGIPGAVAEAAPQAVLMTPQLDALNLRLSSETSRVRELEANLAVTTRTNQQLTADVRRVGDLETRLAETTKANQQLTADVRRFADLETRFAETTKVNQQLTADVRRMADLEARLAEFGRVNLQLTADVRRLGELQTQLADAGKLNERLTRDLGRVTGLEARLAEAVQENSRLKAETARASDLERRLAQAESLNAQLSVAGDKKVTIAALATNLGAQISQAQETINAQRGALSLASVRVHVKGVVEDGATKMTLLNAAELAKPDAASGLAGVDLDFQRPAAPPPPTGAVQVPDVRRLTEGAVRQILHSIGLRLEVVKGPPGSGGVAPGQASLQAPAAGGRAERGSAVTVVFAS